MTHKKQTVYIRHSEYDSERVENVYVLTSEDLLALRRKWAGEAGDAGENYGWASHLHDNKENYMNNLTLE